MQNLASFEIFQLKVVVFVLDGYIDGFSLYLDVEFDSSTRLYATANKTVLFLAALYIDGLKAGLCFYVTYANIG
jgi:hypothetical protein